MSEINKAKVALLEEIVASAQLVQHRCCDVHNKVVVKLDDLRKENNLSDMSEVEKWEAISNAGSIEKLRDAVRMIGPVIEVSGGRGGYDMHYRLNKVIEGDYDYHSLTRNYNIRQQYLYLSK